MTNESALAVRQNEWFLAPVIDVKYALEAYQAKKDFIDHILKEGTDYGPIPGNDKKALLKPGAEKLANLYGYCPVFDDVETIEDWTGEQHGGESFFYYRQKCKLYRGERLIGSADGSCNSWEKKYRYRWVGADEVPAHLEKSKLKTRGGKISELAFAVEKAETTGRYAKPAEYWKQFKDAIAKGTAVKIQKAIKNGELRDAWEIGATQYQIPNDDVAEQVNTILKMAQKRALVAAVLITTGASDYFTQDIEDFIDGSYTFVPENAAPAEWKATDPHAPIHPPVEVRQTAQPTNGNGKANEVRERADPPMYSGEPAETSPFDEPQAQAGPIASKQQQVIDHMVAKTNLARPHVINTLAKCKLTQTATLADFETWWDLYRGERATGNTSDAAAAFANETMMPQPEPGSNYPVI
jgi:hypothetical protein